MSSRQTGRMAITTTGRFGFKVYGAGTDPHPNRDEFNALMNLIDTQAARTSQSTTALRPAAGKQGTFNWDTTASRLFYDNGSSWQEVTTNGGGGAGSVIVPATAGTEGTSARSARADHTHNLPLATASADGALSAADKALLNTASATPTPNSLVKLDGSGRAQVAAPSAGGDITNKTYVDAQVATKAASSHTHDAADVISGTFAAARIPLATTGAAGAMTAADRVLLNGASALATPNTLVKLDAAGRTQVATPSAAADTANKGYVDAQTALRALASHTHPWADISGKPATYASDWGTLANIPATMPSTWATVSGKPTIFPTDWANVAGKPATMPSTWATVSGKPTTFDPTAHTHIWADITDKPVTFTPASHTHNWFDLTGVPNASRAQSGIMTAAAYALLYDATTAYATNNIVMRDGLGNIQINRPTADIHGANKLYVDDQMAAARAGKLDVATFTAAISTTATARALRSPNVGSWITCYDNGVVEAPTIYSTNAATGSAWRAVWVNSTGGLGYNLSSEKYKTEIEDYVVPLSVLDDVKPKRFKYKQNVEELGSDAAPVRVNFIAEHVFDAGMKEFVSFDNEDPDKQTREHVETINEQLMVNALWSICAQLKAEIDELKAGR
ncbi:minor tail protein [Arthrobacter phage Piccoletto]|uniref:Minor tail protein n=1 Tax=Arthrobacter phage Piccoletto TaxID=2024282 RepID=A0A222Z944_9CAUD|nr:minor tail protein [Arthrobacter phage Piccoletto]ASR80653.1 minor tail protein [Arthrobacter phage Piccoletto]